MNETQFGNTSPNRPLLTMRIIWLAMLLGQLMLLAVIMLVILPQQHQHAQPQRVLVWVNYAMLLTVVPVTFFIRTMTFRRTETERGIPAAAYATGNIIFWAGCEGVSFFGLVVAIINGTLWPTIVISVIAMALQLLTFPIGGRLFVPDRM